MEGKLRTQSGEDIPFDALIIATDPRHLLPQLAGPANPYHATTTLYYRSSGSVLPDRLIALVEKEQSPVNNFCEMAGLQADYAPANTQLVSVTLKDIPTAKNAEEKIATELRQLTGRSDWKLEPVARYDIPQALPKLDHLAYDLNPTQSRVTDQIFLAGDQLLFGSLDAAMRSGRRAAEGVMEALQIL